MKTALVLGAAGFLGHATATRLKREGFWVQGIDLRLPLFEATPCDRFIHYDLRQPGIPCQAGLFDEVYQYAADMGGAGYIFTGEHDADVMSNSVAINQNVAKYFGERKPGHAQAKRLLYTSSSCVYPESPSILAEGDAYPASPVGCDYGWEKLFSERLYQAYHRNYGLNVCITRFATVYGPGNCYDDGREKAVAALCRKAFAAKDGGDIEVWGDGGQVRPLIYIDDVVDACVRLARSDFAGPMNVSDERTIKINDLARLIIGFSNKRLDIRNVPGPTGPYHRNLSCDVAESRLGWRHSTPLETGIERTYDWVAQQMGRARARSEEEVW